MKLASDINLHRTNDEAIIIGSDTNQSFKSSKRRSDAMDDFKHDFHLNTILHSNEATFHHNNLSSSSQIDHILYDTNEVTNISIKFFEHLCTLENDDNLSSHDVILGELNLKMGAEPVSAVVYSHTYEDFVAKKPKWNKLNLDKYQQETSFVLQELLNTYHEPEFIPALSEMFAKAWQYFKS